MTPFVLDMAVPMHVIFTLPQLIDDLIAIRQQIEILEAKKQQLESAIAPLAKAEVLVNKQQVGNKTPNTFFRSAGYQLVYQERLDKKALHNHQDMESVAHDIQAEREQAERENQEAIATAKKTLDRASARINKLSQTEEGRAYEREREELIVKLTPDFMVPVIAVKTLSIL